VPGNTPGNVRRLDEAFDGESGEERAGDFQEEPQRELSPEARGRCRAGRE